MTPLDTNDFVYRTGTLTIAPGDTTAVFTGANLTLAAKDGDYLEAGGVSVPIKSVTDGTHAELFYPWPGTAITDGDYLILKASLLRYHTALVGYDSASFIAMLDGLDVVYAVEGAAPDPSLGEDGNRALKMNVTPWKAWLKTGGVWVPQASPAEKGDTGDDATIQVGDTVTLAPGEPATVENVGTPGAAVLNFGIPAGAAATVEVGTVTTLPAGSAATVTTTGTEADAVLDFGIPKGMDGTGIGDMVAANNLSELTDEAVARENLGATAVGDALFTANDVSTARTSLDLGDLATKNQSDLGAFGFRNRVINPSGQINQGGTGTAADGTYWFDQWVHLNQSNPVTPSQLTNVENGTPFMMRTTQSNATAQRFGLIQPLEMANCIDLRGQTVTLSARVRMSASTTLRTQLSNGRARRIAQPRTWSMIGLAGRLRLAIFSSARQLP
jgi:hypothetical protein